MIQRVNLNKKVYGKNDYQKTIDTSFKELLPIEPTLEVIEVTVEDFFSYYDQLFFDIPKTGDNSHNTLIQKSSEYVGDEQTNEELNALYQEIDSLRQQLIETQTELVTLQQNQISGSINV